MATKQEYMDRDGGAGSSGGNGVAQKLMPFGGYYTSKVPGHDPELTETGPGTPMGEYMRAFWHPLCMSLEITDTPHFVKLLGEELVAFRDGSGRLGVLHAHCVHRGASLEYGADPGARHPLLLPRHGLRRRRHLPARALPQGRGEGSREVPLLDPAGRIQGRRAPRPGLRLHGRAGSSEPPFPEWEGDFTVADGDELAAYSNFQHCNWLQVQDNAADNFHPTALHNRQATSSTASTRARRSTRSARLRWRSRPT